MSGDKLEHVLAELRRDPSLSLVKQRGIIFLRLPAHTWTSPTDCILP